MWHKENISGGERLLRVWNVRLECWFEFLWGLCSSFRQARNASLQASSRTFENVSNIWVKVASAPCRLSNPNTAVNATSVTYVPRHYGIYHLDYTCYTYIYVELSFKLNYETRVQLMRCNLLCLHDTRSHNDQQQHHCSNKTKTKHNSCRKIAESCDRKWRRFTRRFFSCVSLSLQRWRPVSLWVIIRRSRVAEKRFVLSPHLSSLKEEVHCRWWSHRNTFFT